MPTVQIDESFLMVAAHLEQNVLDKIIQGEYVDFSKLIAKDRVLLEEDNRMQIINKGGETFWVPASQSEVITINCYSKWEQAFRVFSDVYLRAHPYRASELVQYNHVIHTAVMSYTWDNVYMYDKEFRLHMSRNPARSWAIILQQSWSIRLKDKIRSDQVAQPHTPGPSTPGGSSSSSYQRGCRRFNKG